MDYFASSSNYIFTHIIIIIIIIATLTGLRTTQCRRSDEFNACSKTFNCGNLTGLTYPFYGLNRPAYCGHPGFELLNCDQRTFYIRMPILKQMFYVFGIHANNSTIIVSRVDHRDGFGCPLTLVNITIDFSKFQYTSSNKNITLIYNDCTSQCKFFPCPMGGGTPLPICFMTDKMMLKMNISEAKCKNRLFLPVQKADYTAMDDSGAYQPNAAWDGFELKWTANNGLCQECLRSGGQCGHDPKSNKFFCFCSDESKCPYSGSV